MKVWDKTPNLKRSVISRISYRKYDLTLAFSLLMLGVGLRLLPHPPNFAPVAAIAIFGGAVLPKKLAIWTPLVLMMISDAIIGFHSLIAITWGCYALTAFVSSRVLRGANVTRTAVVTLASSVLFYLVTNFAVWLSSSMYPHSWNGLEQCYIMALPFFRNTILGDAIYTFGLFGAYRLVRLLYDGHLADQTVIGN